MAGQARSHANALTARGSDAVPYEQLLWIDRLVLHKLHAVRASPAPLLLRGPDSAPQLTKEVTAAYDECNFSRGGAGRPGAPSLQRTAARA